MRDDGLAALAGANFPQVISIALEHANSITLIITDIKEHRDQVTYYAILDSIYILQDWQIAIPSV